MEHHFKHGLEGSRLTSSFFEGRLAEVTGSKSPAWLLQPLTEIHRHPKDQREVKGWCRIWHGFMLTHISDMPSHKQHTEQTWNRQTPRGWRQPLFCYSSSSIALEFFAHTYAHMYTYGHLCCHLGAQEKYWIQPRGANELNCVQNKCNWPEHDFNRANNAAKLCCRYIQSNRWLAF